MLPLQHQAAGNSDRSPALLPKLCSAAFPPPSAQTSHVASSHATNTSKTSSLASVMEAIKISDSTDNHQGHQLTGTLLSDNQGFIDFKKKKKKKRYLYFFFYYYFFSSSTNLFAGLFQTRGPEAGKVDPHPTASLTTRYHVQRTPLALQWMCLHGGDENRIQLNGSSLGGSRMAMLELRAKQG